MISSSKPCFHSRQGVNVLPELDIIKNRNTMLVLFYKESKRQKLTWNLN